MNEFDIIAEYWDKQPCNIGHSFKPIGSKEYFDEVEMRKYFVEPHILRFVEFEKWMRKDVIEFGCGIGTDAINFMRVGANYLGIDLSPRSVQIANQRCKVFGFAQSCHVHNMEEEIPHVSTKFDLVYSFGVLHHTPHPQLALERMRNVIARDGELRIMLYATNSWKKMMINAGLDQYEAQYGCPVVYTYHPDEIYELLSPEWRVNSIEQTHIFPYIVEDYKKLSYVKQPYFSAMNEKMFATLEKNLGWHLLIKATPK